MVPWLKRLTVAGAGFAVVVLLGLEGLRWLAVKAGVEETGLPPTSEIAARAAGADYSDAFRVPLLSPVSLERVVAVAPPPGSPVFESASEVVYEGGAPGLRYLVSLRLAAESDAMHLTMGTAVFYDSPLGVAYFTAVRIGHRRLVPFLLRQLRAKLAKPADVSSA